jgi:di/tricarboxylate transporter
METKASGGVPVKLIASLAFISLGIILAIIEPFGGLDTTGHIMLGTVIAALSTWIFKPGSGAFIVGVAIIFIGGMFAGVPMSDLAFGFSSPSLWQMIAAMFIGAALMKTGLGKRLVLSLFKRLNLTYVKILIGWFFISILFALITPVATVRFLILTPIAVSVADACRLEKGSRGRSLIIISCWTLSIFPSIAWMNGSLFGPGFSAFLPEGPMRDMATEEMWFRVMAPWLIFSVVFAIVLYFVLKPEKELDINKAQISQMYDELGPASKQEKGCLAVLIFVIVCLILQTFLPFTTGQALLASLVLLMFLGVLSVKDISTGANWDVIMFFGAIMSFAQIFNVSGLTAWLSPFLSSLMGPIAFSPIVFVLALFALCVLIRFLDVSQGWISSAILALATPMLFEDHGIHPLIPIMVFVSASNVFFFRYAQPWIVQVESVCGDSGWNPRHLTAASVLYVALAAVMLVISRFYWSIVGIL